VLEGIGQPALRLTNQSQPVVSQCVVRPQGQRLFEVGPCFSRLSLQEKRASEVVVGGG
jgi:hypothetical protein